MDERVEVTFRVTLDRSGLQRRIGRPIENDFAFFVLGLVNAHLSKALGDDHCRVEMESATGYRPEFIRTMSSFARRHKAALDALLATGEAVVEDHDVLEVLQQLHQVVIIPTGSKWRVVRRTEEGLEAH